VTDRQKQDMRADIIEYKAKYARHFHDINTAWLEEFFSVEPYDRIVLNDPQEHIIRQGGFIFFARVKGEIVGTCALLKHAEKKYELAKMGVLGDFRGCGIGRLLVQAAIDKAQMLGADTLVLATSRKLEAANRLYHSMGFQEADRSVIGPLPYKRESIVLAMHF
jgi:GNAT superfamily N-acetyltransferase